MWSNHVLWILFTVYNYYLNAVVCLKHRDTWEGVRGHTVYSRKNYWRALNLVDWPQSARIKILADSILIWWMAEFDLATTRIYHMHIRA